MEEPRIRALRQAQLYGYLVARTGRVYYPGGSRPVCSVQTALEMVRARWLVRRGDRYEITPEGLRVLSESPDPPDEGQSARSHPFWTVARAAHEIARAWPIPSAAAAMPADLSAPLKSIRICAWVHGDIILS